MNQDLITAGWREWRSLPELGLTHIKAKINTDAETSCLHTFSVIVTGRTNLPLFNEGDALYRIAQFEDIQEEHSPELIPSPNPESPII